MENTLILEKENSIEITREKVNTPKKNREAHQGKLRLLFLYFAFIAACTVLVFAQWHLLALLLFTAGNLVSLWVYILKTTADLDISIDHDGGLEQKWLEGHLYDPNTRSQ
jgi:cell division septal protein FtsQ